LIKNSCFLRIFNGDDKEARGIINLIKINIFWSIFFNTIWSEVSMILRSFIFIKSIVLLNFQNWSKQIFLIKTLQICVDLSHFFFILKKRLVVIIWDYNLEEKALSFCFLDKDLKAFWHWWIQIKLIDLPHFDILVVIFSDDLDCVLW
jgi:hypothetical protein